MSRFKTIARLPILLWAFFISAAQAEDVIRLEGISIQGNSQEPNVMYIMPWSAPPGTGRLYQPISSYRDQWLQPTDRDRLNREMRYAGRYLAKEPEAGALNGKTSDQRATDQ